MIIFIGITIGISIFTIIQWLILSDEPGPGMVLLSILCLSLLLVSLTAGVPIINEDSKKAEECSKNNTEQIRLAIDSVNYAHKTMGEFNDARFQNTAQESYLLWELLHSIYKQYSIRWYKDIRTSPEYKELDRFLVGDWEDFYLY